MIDVTDILVELVSISIDDYPEFFSKISDEELDAVLEYCKQYKFTVYITHLTWQNLVLDEQKMRIINKRNKKLDTLL